LLNHIFVPRIALRACSSRDAQRLVNDGVLTGTVPAGDSWVARVSKWLDEMQEGRRLVMVAEFGGALVGMGQLIFRFADGYQDADAANGTDIAMVDTIRTRPDAPPNLATHIIGELERYARKRNIRTVTFLVPMDNNRALNQSRAGASKSSGSCPKVRGCSRFSASASAEAGRTQPPISLSARIAAAVCPTSRWWRSGFTYIEPRKFRSAAPRRRARERACASR